MMRKYLSQVTKGEWMVFLALILVHPGFALVFLGFLMWTMEEEE